MHRYGGFSSRYSGGNTFRGSRGAGYGGSNFARKEEKIFSLGGLETPADPALSASEGAIFFRGKMINPYENGPGVNRFVEQPPKEHHEHTSKQFGQPSRNWNWERKEKRKESGFSKERNMDEEEKRLRKMEEKRIRDLEEKRLKRRLVEEGKIKENNKVRKIIEVPKRTEEWCKAKDISKKELPKRKEKKLSEQERQLVTRREQERSEISKVRELQRPMSLKIMENTMKATEKLLQEKEKNKIEIKESVINVAQQDVVSSSAPPRAPPQFAPHLLTGAYPSVTLPCPPFLAPRAPPFNMMPPMIARPFGQPTNSIFGPRAHFSYVGREVGVNSRGYNQRNARGFVHSIGRGFVGSGLVSNGTGERVAKARSVINVTKKKAAKKNNAKTGVAQTSIAQAKIAHANVGQTSVAKVCDDTTIIAEPSSKISVKARVPNKSISQTSLSKVSISDSITNGIACKTICNAGTNCFVKKIYSIPKPCKTINDSSGGDKTGGSISKAHEGKTSYDLAESMQTGKAKLHFPWAKRGNRARKRQTKRQQRIQKVVGIKIEEMERESSCRQVLDELCNRVALTLHHPDKETQTEEFPVKQLSELLEKFRAHLRKTREEEIIIEERLRKEKEEKKAKDIKKEEQKKERAAMEEVNKKEKKTEEAERKEKEAKEEAERKKEAKEKTEIKEEGKEKAEKKDRQAKEAERKEEKAKEEAEKKAKEEVERKEQEAKEKAERKNKEAKEEAERKKEAKEEAEKKEMEAKEAERKEKDAKEEAEKKDRQAKEESERKQKKANEERKQKEAKEEAEKMDRQAKEEAETKEEKAKEEAKKKLKEAKEIERKEKETKEEAERKEMQEKKEAERKDKEAKEETERKEKVAKEEEEKKEKKAERKEKGTKEEAERKEMQEKKEAEKKDKQAKEERKEWEERKEVEEKAAKEETGIKERESRDKIKNEEKEILKTFQVEAGTGSASENVGTPLIHKARRGRSARGGIKRVTVDGPRLQDTRAKRKTRSGALSSSVTSEKNEEVGEDSIFQVTPIKRARGEVKFARGGRAGAKLTEVGTKIDSFNQTLAPDNAETNTTMQQESTEERVITNNEDNVPDQIASVKVENDVIDPASRKTLTAKRGACARRGCKTPGSQTVIVKVENEGLPDKSSPAITAGKSPVLCVVLEDFMKEIKK